MRDSALQSSCGFSTPSRLERAFDCASYKLFSLSCQNMHHLNQRSLECVALVRCYQWSCSCAGRDPRRGSPKLRDDTGPLEILGPGRVPSPLSLWERTSDPDGALPRWGQAFQILLGLKATKELFDTHLLRKGRSLVFLLSLTYIGWGGRARTQ